MKIISRKIFYPIFIKCCLFKLFTLTTKIPFFKENTARETQAQDMAHPIRFGNPNQEVDFTGISHLTSEQQSYLKNLIVPEGLKIISSKIDLKNSKKVGPFDPNSTDCGKSGEIKINPKYINSEVDTDFLIFVGAKPLSPALLAYSSHCHLGNPDPDPSTSRPDAGLVNFNQSTINFEDDSYLMLIETMVHEVLHSLFFSSALFKKFSLLPDGAKFYDDSDPNVLKLRGQNIIETVQNHFQCKHFDGGTPASE